MVTMTTPPEFFATQVKPRSSRLCVKPHSSKLPPPRARL
jgi:hypothetical protein